MPRSWASASAWLLALLLLAASSLPVTAALARFTGAAGGGSNTFNTSTMAAPAGLTATGSASNIALSWTATTTAYASGTQILRSTTSGSGYSQIAQITPRTTTTYTDSPVAGTYYYVARSYYQNWTSAIGSEASAAILSAPTLVQTVTGGGTSGTFSATWAQTPVQNHLLVAIAATRVAGTISTPSGWSTAINQSGTPSQAIFYKIAGASEPSTVTITTTASGTGTGLQLYEYTNINLASPLDITASATGSGTAVSSGTVATGTANDLILVGLVTQQGTSLGSYTNSFVQRNNFTNGGGGGITVFGGAELVVSAAGSYSTTATANGSGAWRGQIVAFKKG